jgi:two-component system, NtrC family, sensor histidine kinase KinB
VFRQVVHCEEFLERAFELFALKAHHQRLTIRFALSETLPSIMVDRILLARTLQLLIDRALDVTPVGGVVVRAKRTAGDVVIVVDDEGPWVSPRDVPRLFLPGSAETDLLAAADLARQLGGMVSATGKPEQLGMRVRLLVPILPTVAQRQQERE